ncbi:MAG TPA: glycosyltransferase family 39 protein [Frankiaceae bacterium]|nr:glycosyltransferase family 39 protein [Frankiaceae bacterium]
MPPSTTSSRLSSRPSAVAPAPQALDWTPARQAAPRGPSRLQRLVRGDASSPVWVRPAVFVLLAGTAVLYLWNLSASGYSNSFYAAAVQAGTKSWKAWFFGSIDAGNSITVDKPPGSLWIMGLSGRIFGFNSWSLLVPQALEGVAAVGLLYAMVKRWAGPVAGLAAGAILALTPAAALMFRFDNPDALLVLLMVAGAYAMTRAIEGARLRWMLLAGSALGFAFLTKDLQAFLPLPAFALAYLVAAPTSVGKRIGHVLAGGAALVVSAGWWVAAVELWPKSSRPYVGGSTNNSVLDLVFGYNGFGRLTGSEGGSPGGGGAAGSSFGGATGITRLLSSEMGNEISWLLPASLVALVAGLWVTRRAPRTDRTRAALLLWGGWLLVTGVVFSYMKGVVHPYYTVALAPAIGALVAIGARAAWVSRAQYSSRLWLAAIVASAGGWSAVLLSRNASWHPEIRYGTLALTVIAVAMLAIPVAWRRRTVIALVAGSMLAGLAGTSAYAAATASQPHTGSIPSVGPASAGGGGGMGGGAPTGQRSGTTGTRPTTGTAPTGTAQGGQTSSSALDALLAKSTQRWAAAVIGSQSAAEYELATGASVMAIGGFSGSDPSPTLAQFEAFVKAGQIHYFIAGGGMGGGMGGAGNGVASQITTWVAAHYKATTVGAVTVYDLTSASS